MLSLNELNAAATRYRAMPRDAHRETLRKGNEPVIDKQRINGRGNTKNSVFCKEEGKRNVWSVRNAIRRFFKDSLRRITGKAKDKRNK